jgi:acyl carrier protein
MEISTSQVPKISPEVSRKTDSRDAYKQFPTAAKIQDWIASYLAERLEFNQDEIDVTIPLERYGLDSTDAIVLTGELEEWLEFEFEPTLIYDYPTIEALAHYVAEEMQVNP